MNMHGIVFFNHFKSSIALLCEVQLSLYANEFFIGWQSGTN